MGDDGVEEDPLPQEEGADPIEIPETVPEIIEEISEHAGDIVKERDRPLLVIFYPPGSSMTDEDVKELFRTFEDVEEEIENLDVLLHTYGGRPRAGYRLPQLIQDRVENPVVLVPEFAFSAGTLFCLGMNDIFLGPYGVLSPIDVKVGDENGDEMHLVSLDNYMEFITRLKKRLTEEGLESNIENDLATCLVEELGAMNVGHVFRTRNLTGSYANKLLDQYLLSNYDASVRAELRQDIVQKLLFENPAHEFMIDFHMAQTMNIPVNRIPDEISPACLKVTDKLNSAASQGLICPYIGNNERDPFIEIFGV